MPVGCPRLALDADRRLKPQLARGNIVATVRSSDVSDASGNWDVSDDLDAGGRI